MECYVCVNAVHDMMMSPNCLHVTCLTCHKQLKDKPCSYCRGDLGVCIKVSAKDYHCFNPTDDEATPDLPSPTAFEILFTPEYKVMYLLFKSILKTKWTSKTDYNYNPVCQVCMMQHSYPDVNIALLNLFYACATITQDVILDALTCLNMMYGWRRCCNRIAPKDVFFHFFINHCGTAKLPGHMNGFSDTADFVNQMLHSVVYDCPEIDNISNFITNIIENGGGKQCPCNTAHNNLVSIQTQPCTTGAGDDEDDYEPFVPDSVLSAAKDKVRWNNDYKWSDTEATDECVDEKSAGDDDDEAGKPRTLAVDCLRVYLNCDVCTSMMDVNQYAGILNLDTRVQAGFQSKNISTSVYVICQEEGYDQKRTDTMLVHYTNPLCKMNRVKFINFFSLVKQPESLTSNEIVEYLFKELFHSKQSYVCPNYHLACICDKVVNIDSSEFKKTKRNQILRWSARVIQKHTK